MEKDNVRQRWAPVTGTYLWRCFGLLLFGLLWVNYDGSEAGVVLLLFLAVMALLRWRFVLPVWSVIFDQIVVLVIIPFWPPAVYGLGLPVFEAFLAATPLYALPVLFIFLLWLEPTLALFAVLLLSGLSGWFLHQWALQTLHYCREADNERRDRYALEGMRDELLFASVETARAAELAERDRIAQELHDDVGHELTSAVLAMQAFYRLWEEGDPKAKEMFLLAQQRLNNSAYHLREVVHNKKPVAALGVVRLQEICRVFLYCPVDFQSYGDTSKIPVHCWSILEYTLKEALTNAARYSKATRVDVSLDVNPHIVRFCIQDNGVGAENQNPGIGIRNLRQRARAAGGNVSTHTKGGFALICVLPLDHR